MSRLSERIENFNRAFNLYTSVRSEYLKSITDTTKLAVTQAYEIVIELGWKVLKDYLSEKGIKVLTPIDTVKEAFSAEIIENGEIWIDMIKDRNSSSLEYNMEKADEIIQKAASAYYEELDRFHKQLGALNGRQ